MKILNRRNLLIIVLLFLINLSVIASNPKREFRGAWIATFKNIDWPSSINVAEEFQKQELIQLFQSLKHAGINAVFFQVRTECDALYESQYEPWSYYLSGKQGKSVLYDPLGYALQLSKKHGMEFHAWINPFRVKSDTSGYEPDSTHISRKHPEWIIQSGNYRFLNPGLPEVREYVEEIVLDIVSRYDIDGVHFDDYFYPYTGMKNEDHDSFILHNNGIEKIEDWRRSNINNFVRDIYTSIKTTKSYVKFGISPFGIWKDSVPEGIKGKSSYHTIYCDAVYWLKQNIVDYIVPQIYWKIGGKQDYIKLSNWWAEQSKLPHVYIGHALYKMDREDNPWVLNEISNQIKFNQMNEKIKGSVYFRASDIYKNLNGVADSLKYKYYKFPALIPRSIWIDSIPSPLFPFSLRAIPSVNGTFLTWENPRFAEMNDQIHFNVVYRFKSDSIFNISDGKNVLGVLPAIQSSFVDTTGEPGSDYTYLITALDRLHNESKRSNTASAKYSQLELLTSSKINNKLFDVDSGSILNKINIKFSINKEELVNLSVFNINGEKIRNLLNEKLNPGTYVAILNLKNLYEQKYYYKLTTPTYSELKSFRNNRSLNFD